MEIEELLDKLGLSQYEKQAYLALLRLGRAKSRQISKESNVSYGRIYEILEKLEQKGLVSILPTEPKSFEAIDPKTALRMILRKKTQEITDLQKEVKNIKIPAKRIPETIKDKTIIVHGKQKMMQLIAEMDERVKKEKLSIPGVFQPNIGLQSIMRRTLKKGVKSRRLLRKLTPKNREIIKEQIKLGSQVRQKDLTGLRLKNCLIRL
ncbi:TrmB family transcriptional regulator [Thermoproteota archaeon]